MDHSKILLNEPVPNITSRLNFLTTTNQELIDSALYKQPTIGGANIITVNDDDSETDINLESLFELALTNSAALSDLFISKESK